LPKKIISFAHCRIYFLAKTKLQFKGAESMAQLPLFFYRTTVISYKVVCMNCGRSFTLCRNKNPKHVL
jgi:hypothetical protein